MRFVFVVKQILDLFTNVGVQVVKYEYIYRPWHLALKSTKRHYSIYLWEHLVLRFANKLPSDDAQALAITDMELWQSSCDDMHWQQGKCHIHSW